MVLRNSVWVALPTTISQTTLDEHLQTGPDQAEVVFSKAATFLAIQGLYAPLADSKSRPKNCERAEAAIECLPVHVSIGPNLQKNCADVNRWFGTFLRCCAQLRGCAILLNSIFSFEVSCVFAFFHLSLPSRCLWIFHF